MYSSSRKVFAIALAIGLCCLIPSILNAQNKCCPVVEKPAPVTCCPVDPKEVRKAQKEAEHAAHEAAEACHRQQKAAAKAQGKIDEEFAEQQAKVDKANEKVARRNAEFVQANEDLQRLTGGFVEPAETPHR
jgi:hypothetical protein